MKKSFIAAVIGLLIHTNAMADNKVCRSEQKLSGCFILSASLSFDPSNHTFVFQEEADPICAVWPPFFQAIFGTYEEDVAGVDLFDKDKKPFGSIRKFFVVNPVGEIKGYTFINCKPSKLTE